MKDFCLPHSRRGFFKNCGGPRAPEFWFCGHSKTETRPTPHSKSPLRLSSAVKDYFVLIGALFITVERTWAIAIQRVLQAKQKYALEVSRRRFGGESRDTRDLVKGCFSSREKHRLATKPAFHLVIKSSLNPTEIPLNLTDNPPNLTERVPNLSERVAVSNAALIAKLIASKLLGSKEKDLFKLLNPPKFKQGNSLLKINQGIPKNQGTEGQGNDGSLPRSNKRCFLNGVFQSGVFSGRSGSTRAEGTKMPENTGVSRHYLSLWNRRCSWTV